jgi:hypothetical protein
LSLDPFRPANQTIEFVDSAAGSRKTFTAVEKALIAARRRGARIIFAMPTHKLIDEMTTHARLDGKVPVYEITSRLSNNVVQHICKHVERVKDGHLLFITHEGLLRVTKWPDEAKDYELYIDEVLDTILNRAPFKLRDNHWVLTRFLDAVPVPATIAERQKAQNNKVVSLKAWKGKKEKEVEPLPFYYHIIPKYNVKTKDPLYWLKRHEYAKQQDDIYTYLDPIAKWLLQGNALFTDANQWNLAQATDPEAYKSHLRGLITITGFRRPDSLKAFKSVTVMSALFKYTMLYQVWQQLGVEFVPSQTVTVNQPTTDLGKRKLKIYWLSNEGWSKRTRDRSGGITNILNLIKESNILNPRQPVCVVVNKDDGSETNPGTVTAVFPKAVVMPNNVRGQNRWRHYHQLIHCAALNSYTSDIRWMESVLGIDSHYQRLGRTGHEVYQALMRLNLRDPNGKGDIILVVVDKDIAEWLPQWFSPSHQVSVEEIDSNGVIKKKKSQNGRPPIGEKRMTAAEQKRLWRLNHPKTSV